VTFGTLTVIVLAGLGGPLLSASERILVPVVVGELLAGLLIGKTGFDWIHPADPTLAFMAAIGFAMLMFAAGLHVPIRTPRLATRLRRGAIAAALAGGLAAGAGILAARISGIPHPAAYAVMLASGSAAVLVPSLQEAQLLDRAEGLVVAAQVSVADIAAVVAVPLALQPGHATTALLGACIIAVCATAIYFCIRAAAPVGVLGQLRRLSRDRSWALDLRLSLLVLFALSWVALRFDDSVLIAGFAVGLMVAAAGGPERLSGQVTGIGQGFFVPLFFVVLGARIDVRALERGSLIAFAAMLVVFNVLLHLAAAALTRQPVASGLAATVQLGVPAAVASLGLQTGVVSPGAAAAIMASALVSIAISGAGVFLLHRRAAAAGATLSAA
jgi:Kef-type K+ transport system membrane component KefB